MGDELSLLLEIFNKIEKAGGQATLSVAFCCRIIAACTLSSFEVTRKTLVFSMCVAHVVFQVFFVSKYLVTDSARRLNCVMDTNCSILPTPMAEY